MKVSNDELLPAVVFGGLPFYIGIAFLLFPRFFSAVFRRCSGGPPKYTEIFCSPTAVRVGGVVWIAFGFVIWAVVLLH